MVSKDATIAALVVLATVIVFAVVVLCYQLCTPVVHSTSIGPQTSAPNQSTKWRLKIRSFILPAISEGAEGPQASETNSCASLSSSAAAVVSMPMSAPSGTTASPELDPPRPKAPHMDLYPSTKEGEVTLQRHPAPRRYRSGDLESGPFTEHAQNTSRRVDQHRHMDSVTRTAGMRTSGHRPQRIAEDGGIRLAGGMPGQDQWDDSMSVSAASTLPPPYAPYYS